MKKEALAVLITKDESSKLNFKRDWYSKKNITSELIKDIIALTNGNIHSIGQAAHL